MTFRSHGAGGWSGTGSGSGSSERICRLCRALVQIGAESRQRAREQEGRAVLVSRPASMLSSDSPPRDRDRDHYRDRASGISSRASTATVSSTGGGGGGAGFSTDGPRPANKR